jgi:hypothetical protein
MRRRLAAFKLALGAIVGGTFSQWRTFKANSYHYHFIFPSVASSARSRADEGRGGLFRIRRLFFTMEFLRD